MFAQLLQQIFFSQAGQDAGPSADTQGGRFCRGGLADAVEHIVDTLDSRLRMAPRYSRRLGEPLAGLLRYIDQVGESIPGPVVCSRSSFSGDAYANAFFASPQHIQEVFSQSEEVRRLFDDRSTAEDCWALLCMSFEEKTQPGLTLVGDEVRRDVMQTSINLGNHQVVSPGIDEASARCALKCCMFDAFLSHIQREMVAARTRDQALQARLQALRARLRREAQRHGDVAGDASVRSEIDRLESQRVAGDAQLGSVAGRLEFVVEALSRPQAFISAEPCLVHVNRRAVKLEPAASDAAADLRLSKIRIAAQGPRVGALVRFPRSELLPRPDMLKQADLFLAV
jgi:hypothetical protein